MYRICVANSLECLARAWSLVLIRVELQRQLSVRFLQFRLGGVLGYTEDLVVILASSHPKTEVSFVLQ